MISVTFCYEFVFPVERSCIAMQRKVGELFDRIPARHFILGAALIAVLVIAATGRTNAAVAAAPDLVEGWAISVDGEAVAGGEDAATLVQLYEAVLDSYRTEDTYSVQALNEVEFIQGEFPVSLPWGNRAQTALTKALTVQTIECVTVTETLDYGTVTVEDDSMYEDESTTVEGHAGEKVTTSYEVCVNGELLLVKPGGSEITEEPVDTVVTVGTMTRPEFIWPTHGTYTGSYGIDTINGANRTHGGIDIANSTGTDIVAARAGTVVFAGWDSSGYGYLVIIQHDNGTHTYYAHNSSILVSVGDTVEQGEHIAEMGATGRATGVHCHFEVRLGTYNGSHSGKRVNPLNYLSLSDL